MFIATGRLRKKRRDRCASCRAEKLRLLTLAAKAVESAILPFECVHDIEARHRFATAVFGIHDGITNDILKEDLEDAASFLVHEAGDAFLYTMVLKHAISTCVIWGSRVQTLRRIRHRHGERDVELRAS